MCIHQWWLEQMQRLGCGLVVVALAATSHAEETNAKQGSNPPSNVVADPDSKGGEPESIVQVANLIYAGTKTSECFADNFLRKAESDSSISTTRRLHSVKLSSDEIYNFPMVIMTGEGEFDLLPEERDHLSRFVQRGGFLLASAGCSSPEWNRSFRREMVKVFPGQEMAVLPMDHLIFHTAYDIADLKAKHGTPRPLEGIHFGSRLGVLYSQDGLNDTSNAQGCCCCGGNEITNAEQVNVNIVIYSLLQ
ncbi:hypothetical protein Enr13x_34220 [Stieleria neptunia]|uniref:DUF4159 domain-containing protein n=1 Tax=Stieleria neptunia TaxID=2527979 RepID=A0A518HRT9_9BACT|nr:DUF4159 domain-containing protein [Stieleria neptunia]QDV43565.1 hypothetical protein Enr13x_34220 [Stieleria neptunia]